ncbi:MAG: toll/interleukin-1 receptor domain-containing protein [Bacteroidales bacterium]|nr:toll/interleukin-1 receptor domain-containing protein [Bacteroidales bacterium]
MAEKLYDVFISYSSKDQKLVEAMCHYLEERNLRCFVSYRDVPKGKDWGPFIEKGIEDSKVLVYVHTESGNMSEETTREINLAFKEGCVVIPFRVDSIEYGKGKKYRLNNVNWLDAFPQSPENYFGDLFDFLKVNFPERIQQKEDQKARLESERAEKERIKGEKFQAEEKLQVEKPQPRLKPNLDYADFNTEYNRCITTEQYLEAFALCLNEAVVRQNVSSIKSKADIAIENLKDSVLIPDCVAHVSYNWLIDRLSAKGYSPIKMHKNSISYKDVIRFRISNESSNMTQVYIGRCVNMFWIFLVSIIVSISYFVALVFAIRLFTENLDGSSSTAFDRRGWFWTILICSSTASFIVVALLVYVTDFFKRKKKVIRDLAKICLEECER